MQYFGLSTPAPSNVVILCLAAAAVGLTLVLRHAHSPPGKKPQAANTTHILHIRQSEGQPLMHNQQMNVMARCPKDAFLLMQVPLQLSLSSCNSPPTSWRCASSCSAPQSSALRATFCQSATAEGAWSDAWHAAPPVRGPAAMHLLACYQLFWCLLV